MALVDGATGDTITSDGRLPVETYGADGFPFTKSRLERCRIETDAQKRVALQRLGSLSFLGPLTTVAENSRFGGEEFTSVAQRSEVVALAFVKGRRCCNCTLVLTKLIEVQRLLGEQKLGIVLIPLEKDITFEEELRRTLKDTPMVQPGKKRKHIAKQFESVAPVIETPHIVVISKNNDEATTFKLHGDDVAREIYHTGCAGYPWSSDALAALASAEANARAEFKRKQKNLEFLACGEVRGGRSEAFDRHGREMGHEEREPPSCVIDANGEEVGLQVLQSNAVVGLYFAASWCPSCEEFTSVLADAYEQCREEGKSLEIVFVSSDRSREEFADHVRAWQMPWCTLRYSERRLKDLMCELYDVTGTPKLVLLTGAGDLITRDGIGAVERGVEYFPWYEDVTQGWLMTASYVGSEILVES